MDSMSPKSAELTQMARNQLRSEQHLKHPGLSTGRNRSGIVGRSLRFVFKAIPELLRARFARSKAGRNGPRGRRAKI